MTQDMPQSGIELIVYQLGEVKTGISTLASKMDGFQDRLTALEQWRAITESRNKDKNGVLFNWVGDNGLLKIAILALSVALGVITLVSSRIIK